MTSYIPILDGLVPLSQRLIEVCWVIERIDVSNSIEVKRTHDKVNHHLGMTGLLEEMSCYEVPRLPRTHNVRACVSQPLPHENLGRSWDEAKEDLLQVFHRGLSFVDQGGKIWVEWFGRVIPHEPVVPINDGLDEVCVWLFLPGLPSQGVYALYRCIGTSNAYFAILSGVQVVFPNDLFLIIIVDDKLYLAGHFSK